MDRNRDINLPAVAAAKANRILGKLARAVRLRDRITFPRLYMTHVRPVLEYAGTAWSPYLAQDREVLEKVQRRIVNMIPGLNALNCAWCVVLMPWI